MSSIKLGMNCKLYYKVGGQTVSTPDADWLEMTNATNVTAAIQTGEADVTTRANNGWKASVATLKEASFDFEAIYDITDPGFLAFKEAFLTNAKLGLRVLDGGNATAGTNGLSCDVMVTGFSIEQPLAEAMKVKITAKPTYTGIAPSWYTAA